MNTRPVRTRLSNPANGTGRRTRLLRPLAALGLVAFLLVGALSGCSKPPAPRQFWCPMHPEVVSTSPDARCDRCGGMKLVPKDSPPAAPAPSAPAAAAAKYHCPMHPTVVSDRKGSCPICGMDLVPISPRTGEPVAEASTVPGLASITISPEIRQRTGLTLGTVARRSLRREVRTSARIVADETRQYRVTTKIAGWVELLYVNITGQEVKQGQPLLTIYSPELVSAQEEYLIARRTRDKLTASKVPDTAAAGEDLLQASRRRLELWDISDEQIQRLDRTQQVEKTLTLQAPASGVVLEKNVLEGQQIRPGDSLLVIANLDHLWADADIYQSDLPHVEVGLPVEVTLPYWPGKVFKGKVSFISPALDPGTRTARARLEIENRDLLLKPDMYANARVARPLGEVLAIPEGAVLRTGDRTYAFKDGGDGRLTPVVIKIGPRSDGYFELVEGLQEGDQVVTSANFLVDSESSLKAALAAMGSESGEPKAASGERAAESGESKDPHAGHRR